MTDSNLRALFERFAAAGVKHAFQFRDDRAFLGWIMEVTDEAVLLMWAPSPIYAQATGTADMSPEDEWVRFSDIELGSLACWDESTRRWVDFVP